MILIDTSILVDYFRKKEKERTLFYKLSIENDFAISTVSEFELFAGLTEKIYKFLNILLDRIIIFPFDSNCARIAGRLYRELKRNKKLIPPPDIFIAATAITNDLALATLNIKHFERIKGLQIVQ